MLGYIVEEKSKILRANSSEKLRERHRLSLSLSLFLSLSIWRELSRNPWCLLFMPQLSTYLRKGPIIMFFMEIIIRYISLVLVLATSSNHIGASCRLDIRKRIGLNVTNFSDQGFGIRVNDWTLALGMQELVSYMKISCAPFFVS
jgi:hypothetical protein